MDTISLADAKARLSELIERVASGDTVCITRRGKPIAQLSRIAAPRAPLDVAALRAVTDGMRLQSQCAGDFVRRMRDEDRY